jgi:hypothetical protein
MSDQQNGNRKPPDPFEQWRVTRDAYVDAWAKALNDVLKNEAAKGDASKSAASAHNADAVLDALLTASAPFRDTLQKITTVALQQLGIPTRDDFADIADRMSKLGLRLEEIDAKLDRVENLLSRSAPRKQKPLRPRSAKKPVI